MAFTPRAGMQQAEEAARSQRGNFARAQFLSIEDGHSVFARLMTEVFNRCGHIDDDGYVCDLPLHQNDVGVEVCNEHGSRVGEPTLGWITVDQHANVKTRQQPDGYEGNWPKSLPAVCRRDVAFGGQFEDCYICDHIKNAKNKKMRPQPRQWALLCLREEVREGGQIIGYRDKTRTEKRTVDGKDQETEVKDIVIANYGWNNFFGVLSGSAEHYGTCLDRDYKITRKGDQLDTEYRFAANDPIDIELEDEDGNAEEVRYDLRDPRIAARYETDVVLADEIARRASDEYYDLFFDERHEQGWTKNEGDGGSSNKRPKADKSERDASPDSLRALANRVKGYSGDEAEGEQQTDDETEDDQTEAQAPAKEPERTKAPAAAKAPPKKAAATAKKAPAKKAPAKKAASKARAL